MQAQRGSTCMLAQRCSTLHACGKAALCMHAQRQHFACAQHFAQAHNTERLPDLRHYLLYYDYYVLLLTTPLAGRR